MTELTQHQIDFLKKYIKIPVFFGKAAAKLKRENWSADFREFNVARAKATAEVQKITDGTVKSLMMNQIADAETIVMSNTENPNLSGGHAMLDAVGNAARVQYTYEACAGEIARLAPLIENVRPQNPPTMGQINLTFGVAQAKLASGKTNSNVSDLQAAEAACAATRDLLMPFLRNTAEGQTVVMEMEERQARQKRADADAAYKALKATIDASFTGGVPDVLTQKMATIEATLTVADSEPSKTFADAATLASQQTGELDDLFKPLIALATSYEDKRGALESGAHAVLQGHSVAGHELMTAEIAAIAARFVTAATHATAHAYQDAINEIDGAAADTAQALKNADAVVRFNELRADREARMTKLNALIKDPGLHEAVTASHKICTDMWAAVQKAFTDKDLAKIEATSDHMTKLPAAIQDATEMYWLADEYKRYKLAIETYEATARGQIAGFDQIEKEEIENHIDAMVDLITESSYATTKNMRTSATLIVRAYSLSELIEQKIKAAVNFREAKAEFTKRIAEMLKVEGKDVGAPVVDYTAQLKAAELHAVNLISKGDFVAAQRVYQTSTANHAEMQMLVDKAKAYVEGGKKFDLKVVTVEALPGAAAAADEITAAKDLKTQARSTKDAGDWSNAAFLIGQAAQRLDGAERLAKASEKMDTAKADADAAVNGMGADMQAAVDKANAMIEAFKGSVGDAGLASTWAGKLTAQVQTVAVMDVSTPPNLAAAQQAMRDAMAQIDRYMLLGAKYEAFSRERNIAQNNKQTLDADKASPWDAGPLFDTELAQIQQDIDDAVAAGAVNVADYATAATKLKSAIAGITYVFANRSAAGKARKLQAEIAQKIIDNDQSWSQGVEPVELAAVKADKVTLDAAITAKNYKDAQKLAEALEKRVEGFIHLAANHFWYNDCVTEHLNPAIAALPATQVYSAEERARIADLRAQITALETAHAYVAAQSLIYAVKYASEACAELETDGALYTPKKDAAKAALDDMKAKVDAKAGDLYEQCLELQGAFSRAEDVATGKHFKDATARMEKIAADVAAMAAGIDAYNTYMTTRTDVGKSIADIGKLRGEAVIGPMVERIFGKHTNAIAIGDAGDHQAATALLEEIRKDCIGALRAVAAQQDYEDLSADLTDLAAEDAEGLETAIRRAEGFLEPLKTSDDAFYIFGELGVAVFALGEAGRLQTEDPGAARQQLEIVMTQANLAQMALVQFTQMRANADATRTKIEELLAPATLPAFIRADMNAELLKLNAAMDDVAKQPATRDQALAVIEAVSAEYQRLRLAAKAQEEIDALETAILDKMDQMEKHPQRYAIADDITLIRANLTSAKTASLGYNQGRALEALTKAKALQESALMRATIQGGGVPTQQQLKDMLAKPDGSERLDDLVGNLDVTTQRKVMNEVFMARFGTELHIFKDSDYAKKGFEKFLTDNTNATAAEIQAERDKVTDEESYAVFIEYLKGACTESADDIAKSKADHDAMGTLTPDDYKKQMMDEFKAQNPAPDPAQTATRQAEVDALAAKITFDMAPEEKAPNLRRFYELMSQLPNTDTLTNESLGLFTLQTGAEDAPYYAGSTREVVMIGEESNSPYQTIGLAMELGEVDPDCTPLPGEKMTLLSWNTLHEVGHAVDDKLGFMNRRGTELAGWTEHGSNVKTIADAIAGKYEFDPDYVAAYMSGNQNPELPPPAGGVDALIWDLRRADAIAHVDAIRFGNNPWQSDSSAKFSEIDGVCYHEGYGNTWFSYPFASRAKGVSGYQFRAPGEWFSELYAAYHSGKMNQNHPARAWLETL